LAENQQGTVTRGCFARGGATELELGSKNKNRERTCRGDKRNKKVASSLPAVFKDAVKLRTEGM
jgi:hypothetical protein